MKFQVPVTFKASKGFRVVSGSWADLYSGRTITDVSKLDVDHPVLLLESHQPGRHAWSAYKCQQYANDLSDPNALIAVELQLESSEGHE
jgi:hypothetical protein